MMVLFQWHCHANLRQKSSNFDWYLKMCIHKIKMLMNLFVEKCVNNDWICLITFQLKQNTHTVSTHTVEMFRFHKFHLIRNVIRFKVKAYFQYYKIGLKRFWKSDSLWMRDFSVNGYEENKTDEKRRRTNIKCEVKQNSFYTVGSYIMS